MFAFKFKAKDRQNHIVIDRVVAGTIEDAYDNLAKQGFGDISVLDSKKTAINLNDATSRRRLAFSASQELGLQKQSSLIIKLMMLYARDVKIWGGLLVWLLVSVSLYGLHSAIALVLAGLLIAHILWFVWAMVPMMLYDRALDASFWRRWGELERIMRFLATWKSWFKTPISEREIIFRLASAEAGQGRLEAALKRAAVLKNDSTLAPGFYETRLASVYFAAGDIQLVAMAQKTALQLNPGIANTIDLAITLVRWQDDPKGASILMAGIEGAKLSDLQRITVYYCNGVISLKTKQPEKALDLLTQALEMSKAFGAPHLQVFVIEIHAHLALALCACNRHQDAVPHFSASRPLLDAWKDIALLRQCDLAQSQRS